jgi:hemolysin activation/secretion protein
MNLWGVGLNVHRSDSDSTSSFTFNRLESISGSGRDEFEQARSQADPDFTIHNVAVAHSQFLDIKKVNRLSGSFRFVTSDERLVPAKMTTFGGLYSIRGYEEDEIVADGGILASGQYEFALVEHNQSTSSHKTKSMKARGTEPRLKKLAPLAFIDYGRAKIKSPVPGEKRIQELCSVGVGVIVELRDNFGASLYCGWPLRATDETDEGDVRLNVSLIRRF